MLVIGLLGPIGSGKGVAAAYLVSRYDFDKIAIGDLVREIAKKKGIQPTRENLQDLQAAYRKRYGNLYFAKKVVKWVKKRKKARVVIDGVRVPAEIRLLKRALRAKIVLIDAPASLRFKRLKERKRIGYPKTLSEFKAHEARENRLLGLNRSFALADYKVNNTGVLSALYKRLDRLMGKIL